MNVIDIVKGGTIDEGGENGFYSLPLIAARGYHLNIVIPSIPFESSEVVCHVQTLVLLFQRTSSKHQLIWRK